MFHSSTHVMESYYYNNASKYHYEICEQINSQKSLFGEHKLLEET